ncbi:MAG: 4-hydroxy-tetrahydrodipicolinate reductase [Phycisphaerales bacterium]
MIQVAINGAAGRMGRLLVALTLADAQLRLVAALEHPGSSMLGRDAGSVAGAGEVGVPITTGLTDAKPDVMIDFSVQPAVRPAVKLCKDNGVSLVIGTTGLDAEDEKAINDAAGTIAVLQATNMSLGVNMLFALTGQIARQLGDDYDIEVIEAHHRFKHDAPSGTAMSLVKSICDATGKDIVKDVKHGRHGMEPRVPGEIGVHALRLGDEVGRHTVCFATLGEEVQVTHKASTRDTFAKGALRAAHWLADKPAGRYGMKDVLGL